MVYYRKTKTCPISLSFQTVLMVAVFAATATCKTTPRSRTRAKAKTSTASFFVDDSETTTKSTTKSSEESTTKKDDQRLSLNSLLGNWDYSLTSEDYYYYYYFDDDEESAAKAKVSKCSGRGTRDWKRDTFQQVFGKFKNLAFFTALLKEVQGDC